MASKLRRVVPVIEYLISINGKTRQKWLKDAHDNVIKLIVDLLHNINIGTIPLEASLIDRLRKYKKQIKSITTPKKSLATRRRELNAKDLFFLRIFPLILPVLLHMVMPKTVVKQEQHHPDDDGVQSSNITSG